MLLKFWNRFSQYKMLYKKPGGVCLALNYMICWHGTLGLLGLTIPHQIIVWFVVKKCATSKHFVLINSKWLI